MNALARLIQHRKRELSLSLKEISQRTNGTVSAGALSKWLGATKLDALPRTSSINGIAQALQLPPIRILLAAAQAAGIDVTDPADSTLVGKFPSHIDDLHADSSELLLKMAWHLTAMEQQQRQGS